MDISRATLTFLDATGGERSDRDDVRLRAKGPNGGRYGQIQAISGFDNLGRQRFIVMEPSDGEGDLGRSFEVLDARTWFTGGCLFVQGYQQTDDGGIEQVRWTFV